MTEHVFRLGGVRLHEVPAIPHQLPRLAVENGNRPGHTLRQRTADGGLTQLPQMLD